MSRYIRYKYQKQQINFLNCDELNQWIDTCQTRLNGFDSVCDSTSCNCKEYGELEQTPTERYKKLNPNYNYECLDGNRYYRLQKQLSYDGGISWFDTDEYQIGDMYEANSPWCSAETVLMDWLERERFCEGTTQYSIEVKSVSFDNGNTWSEMGYTDENGVTTYEERKVKIEDNSCNCGALGCDNYISFKWRGNDGLYYTINNKTFTATTTNSIDNGDGTYTFRTSMRDIGIGEVTQRYNMFNYGVMYNYVLEVYEIPDSTDTILQLFFSNMTELTYVNPTALDTSNVTTMRSMFYYCSGLTSLDLSNFNTSKVTDVSQMFYNCKSLITLNVSGWDISKITSYNNMFSNCALKSLILGNVTQEQYDWWYTRLTDVGIQNNVTITYNIIT